MSNTNNIELILLMFNITCEKCFERNENSFTIKIRNKKNKKKIFNETSKNKMKEVCNICKCVMFLLFLFSKKEKELNKI
jgi:hypothetical protein